MNVLNGAMKNGSICSAKRIESHENTPVHWNRGAVFAIYLLGVKAGTSVEFQRAVWYDKHTVSEKRKINGLFV